MFLVYCYDATTFPSLSWMLMLFELLVLPLQEEDAVAVGHGSRLTPADLLFFKHLIEEVAVKRYVRYVFLPVYMCLYFCVSVCSR